MPSRSSSPIVFRQPKRRGELAELRFLLRAAEAGFTVSKPYGDSARFDFIVGDRFPARVQVRSTRIFNNSKAYVCRLTHGNPAQHYRRTDFDFFAIYVVPCDAWYIVPVRAFKPRQLYASLYPHNHNSSGRMERFREAWHLLGDSAQRKARRAA